MQAINLRSFKLRVRRNIKAYRAFLTRLKNNPPRKLDELAIRVDKEVWHEVDCLTCANCCKTMTPTYTKKDMERIASHFGMTVKEMKAKWLYKDRSGDWMNTSTPCQFLDTNNNKCMIYDIRPMDCAGFPHFTKKRMADYVHVHQQNLELCPATYKMVEKMKMLIEMYE